MKMLDINDYKKVKQFNHSYFQASFHHKRKVRKKNYARARRMLGFPMPYNIEEQIRNKKFRKKYKANKLRKNKE